MLNGWYVYGGRRTLDTETFPREYLKIRAMAAVRDRYVWDLAQGKSPAPPDDSKTGELYVPPTRFGNPEQDYSEPEELRYLTPEESIATMKVPDGFEVQPFASEREFPELAKPDQLNFDNRGRLWVVVHADLSAVEAGRPAAERPAADLRRHERRRPGRQLQSVLRQAALPDRLRILERRRAGGRSAAAHLAQGHRRRRPGRRGRANCSTAGPATTRITRSARSSTRTAGCCTCSKASR